MRCGGPDHGRPGGGLVAEAWTPTHDDRVLAYTRGLSLFILPFLLVAFVLLYLFPGDTARLWSWPIKPTMFSGMRWLVRRTGKELAIASPL